MRVRGNSTAWGEAEGNQLCLDATLRGQRNLLKRNTREKNKTENPQAMCGSV